MKRITFLLLMVMTIMGAKAQYRKGQCLVCTGNNVNIRKGPGKNYPILSYDRYKTQLFKRNTVRHSLWSASVQIEYLGKKQNNFLYVHIQGIDGDCLPCEDVWVSADYLKPCPRCKGFGSRCDYCYSGYSCAP